MLPIHVMIKEIANTKFSELPDEVIQSIYTIIKETKKAKMVSLIGYVKGEVKGSKYDLDVTYYKTSEGYSLDEIFFRSGNITHLIDKEERNVIEKEMIKVIKQELKDYPIILPINGTCYDI